MAREPTIWTREDHTEAKHRLLRAFFNKWVSIHSGYMCSQGAGLVRVYDGFAGPGVYAGGEPGSPLILLKALLENANLRTRWSSVVYEFSFAEQNRERAERLTDEIRAYETELQSTERWPRNVTWSVRAGLYEDNVPAPAQGESALFLFIDPFGYSQAPMTLTRDLVQQPKSDTLIFLPLSFVNRFAGRDGQEDALDRFFGTPAWRDIEDGPQRPAALLELFRSQLRSAGLRWTLPFRLRPADRRSEFWIIGASAHLAGLDSVKEGFWAVDPVNGQGFAATRRESDGQQTLSLDLGSASEPRTEGLLVDLRERFGDRTFSVEDAETATRESRFLLKHLRGSALAPAERRGELLVDRPAGARQFPPGRGITMRFVRS